MIQLDSSVVAEYSEFVNPPTHAMLIHHRYNHQIDHNFPTKAYTDHITNGEMYVIYALGTVKDGVFVLSSRVNPLERLIELSEIKFNPQVYGEFTIASIDEAASRVDERLKGTSVPNPATAPVGNGQKPKIPPKDMR